MHEKSPWISECAYTCKWKDSTGQSPTLLNKWASCQILDLWGVRSFCASLIKSLLDRIETCVHVTFSRSFRNMAWGKAWVKTQEDSCGVSLTACHWSKLGIDHLVDHLVVQKQDGLLGSSESEWVLGVIPMKADEFHKRQNDTNNPGCMYNSYSRVCNCTIHNSQTLDST